MQNSILRAQSHIRPLSHVFGIRMISTVTGDSGRVYTNGTLIRQHPQNRELNIYKAEFGGQSFVLKRVSEQFFRTSQQIADDFMSTERLRLHVDGNRKESILVYPYFQDTLLALMKNDPDFPPPERLKIMRAVAVAVAEMHAKGWIHADIKPDNVLVDWTEDDGKKIVTNVVLGDFDIACKLSEGKSRLTQHAIGNAMWRSPEAQSGVTGRASDVYSLGLVFCYILGAGELLLLENYQELLKAGITPEQEVLTRHFAYFGPVPENLFTRIPDEAWRNALRSAAQAADLEVTRRPGLRLRIWGQQMTEPTLDLLSQTNNLDPGARPTIRLVLEHPFWEDAAK